MYVDSRGCYLCRNMLDILAVNKAYNFKKKKKGFGIILSL